MATTARGPRSCKLGRMSRRRYRCGSRGATFEQVAAAGFGIATANGAWRAVHRALARIPKEDADQAREAQLARLQALRLLLWNHAGTDPIKAAEALIKLEARRRDC